MTDKPWKVFERRIANKFESHRTPLSGQMSRHTSSDVLHEGLAKDLFIECKMRKRIWSVNLYKQYKKTADKLNKILVIALHQTGDKRDYFLIEKNDFLRLLKGDNP